MNAYVSLAPHYDALTRDVPYESFAELYEEIFRKYGALPSLILDLACGTGTLTVLLASKGYEMIGVDASEEMLSIAAEKAMAADLPVRPIFLRQEMDELDLFGTVSAAVCSLDGINYLPPNAIDTVFERLRLFIEPGGLFIFDINTPEKLRSQDGELYIDETDDVYCVWRAEFDAGENACRYGVDIFALDGEVWTRGFEEHTEYAHDIEYLKERLRANGFSDISVFGDLCMQPPKAGEERVFIAARRG